MRFNRSLTLFSAMVLGACASAAPEDEAPTGVVTSAVDRDDRDRGHDGDRDERVVRAQVVATGIPGAGAICQIGGFLRGSPIHDRATFTPFTAPGAVLNGERLLVASTSNFGAPLANAAQYAGTVLSVDPSSSTFAVPAGFAAAGDQASGVGGRVQVYASNNAPFLNSRFEPQAVTAAELSVSLPTGISLNNGNGRPWISNAPTGATGDGTITVLDPVGAPLAGAPFPTAGGVFKGNLTNRPGSTRGLTAGAVGTAIFSKSPDGSGRAVFAAAEADGSIVQVHVQKGVDALVPPGTLTPITNLTPAAAASNDRHTIARLGMAFNWVPNRVLYVVDPKTDRVLAFDINDNGTLFTAGAPRSLGAQEHEHRHGHHWDHDDCDGDDDDGLFDIPIDVAPTVPEVASQNFASNSTLAGGADLYVLNRGNNTIVRVTQAGKLVAKRKIVVDGQRGFRVNGLGVSPDGKNIWISGQTDNGGGIVTRIAGFGSGPIMPPLVAAANAGGATSSVALGSFFFSKTFSPNEGVGPLFNAQSCADCHSDPAPGGMSSNLFDTFIAGSDSDPVARFHSIRELGDRCRLPTGIPRDATSTSRRSSMTLRGSSLIDFVQPFDILANRATQPAAIQGRANILSDGRIGKFGWKAATPTLIEFMGQAFRNEQGLTNGLERRDIVDACGANRVQPELDALPLVTTSAFMTTLDPPAPTAACVASPGAAVFRATDCAGCHTPSFPGPGGTRATLYSDLLLHDMGPALADGFVQGAATGREFRTMTLSKLADRSHFLHDGRAADVSSAIQAHGGQGAASATAFGALNTADRDALLAFLGCL